MNDYASRLEKDNQEFASKKLGVFIYAPCWIPIILAFFFMAMGMASEASPYIMMGSLFALVCGSLGLCRKKIIQQDKAIRLLQEKLDEVSSKT
tara:strand:- start:193 stop:471 length:279 start_codon:yes stop_codon:yes gene_type:complete